MATSRRVPLSELKYRAGVRFDAKGGKSGRPGVILRIWKRGEELPSFLVNHAPKDHGKFEVLLLIVACTSVEPQSRHGEKTVEVTYGSIPSKALQLNATSWFKDSMLQIVPAESIENVVGSAPPSLAHALEDLVPVG